MSGSHQNRIAAFWMLSSVVIGSFLAIIVAAYEVADAPFLFSFLNNFLAMAIYLPVLYITGRSLLTKSLLKEVFAPQGDWVKPNLVTIPSILSGVFTFPLFVLASRYIDIVAVVILYEIWPLFMVLMAGRLFRNEGRYNKFSLELVLMFGIAFVGLILITISQTPVGEYLFDEPDSIVIGTILALLAAVINALGPAFDLRHGVTIHQRILKTTGHHAGELNTTLLSLLFRRSVASIITLLLALLLGESLSTDLLIAGALTGILVVGVANIGMTQANLLTTHLGVNAISYILPVLSILWLYGFAWLDWLPYPNILQPQYLVLGATAVIIANVLVNFEASIRTAYKALISGLWVSGLIVYVGSPVGIPGYAEVVVFVATMFILLVSFRTERLVRRTKEEETLTLTLLARMRLTLTDSILRDKAVRALERIDAYQTREILKTAYEELHTLIEKNASLIEDAKGVIGDIHQLVRSKQQGRGWGELVALWFIGGTLLTLLWFFGMSPDPGNPLTPWGYWIMSMVSFVIASTVIFLLWNVRDLQNDRTDPIIENNCVRFRGVDGRNFERGLSLIMGIFIIGMFGILFLFRWVG